MLTHRMSPMREQRGKAPEPQVSSQRHSSDSPDLDIPSAGNSMEETVDEFEATWGEGGNVFVHENQGRSTSVGDSGYSSIHSRDVGAGRDASGGSKGEAWRGCRNRERELLEEGILEEEHSTRAESLQEDVSGEMNSKRPSPASKDTDQGGRESSKVKVRGAGGDVEEGEVSDSSDELSKAGSQLGSQLGSGSELGSQQTLDSQVLYVLYMA